MFKNQAFSKKKCIAFLRIVVLPTVTTSGAPLVQAKIFHHSIFHPGVEKRLELLAQNPKSHGNFL